MMDDYGEIIEKDPPHYTLYKTADGEYVLSVLCGTVLMFGLDIRLNQNEIDLIEQDSANIRHLADQVVSNPQAFFNGRINDSL